MESREESGISAPCVVSPRNKNLSQGLSARSADERTCTVLHHGLKAHIVEELARQARLRPDALHLSPRTGRVMMIDGAVDMDWLTASVLDFLASGGEPCRAGPSAGFADFQISESNRRDGSPHIP